MNIRYLTLLALGCLAFPPLYAQEPLLRYDFANSTPADASGNKRDGELVNGAKIATLPGEKKPVLDNTESTMGSINPGTGGGLRYTGPGLGNLASFTITLWYRIAPGERLMQATRLFEFAGVANKPLLMGASSDEGTLTLNLGSDLMVNNETPRPLLSTPDEWVFVALVFDGTFKKDNLRLFFGSAREPGKIYAINSTEGDLWQDNSGEIALIFGSNLAGGRGFRGWLDDIRIYGSPSGNDGALDVVQLQTILDEGLAGRSSK